jgi:hypothetical protein
MVVEEEDRYEKREAGVETCAPDGERTQHRFQFVLCAPKAIPGR